MYADSGGTGTGEHGHSFASPLKEPRLVLVEFPPRHAVELAADVLIAFKTVRPAADFGNITHAEAGDEGVERIPWKIQVRHPVQQFLLPALILAIDFGISGGIDDGDAAYATGCGISLFLVLEERKMLFDELHDHFPRRGVEFGQLDARGTGVTHLAFRLGFGGIEETKTTDRPWRRSASMPAMTSGSV